MHNKYKFCARKISYTFFYCFAVSFLLTLQAKVAHAVKIVATINDDVITDVDVDEFEQILCKIDKRFSCGSQSSRQIALMTLAESLLKIEHFKQMNLFSDKQINHGFNKYKNGVIKNLNIPKTKLSKTFEDYLHAEYLWNVLISSQMQGIVIKDDEVKNYIKQHNINKMTNKQVKQLIFQEKMNNLSQSTMSDLRKFYLVEIKGF